METRPSALAVVAALNRLGAIVVMMRPDGSPRVEAELGQVSRIVTDPEHAEAAASSRVAPVLVLGGGGEPRDLGFGLTDLERIDPDEVSLPAWYDANPGRAGDLAFIVFGGQDEHTVVNRITNRRWAVSAFGTASAAALTAADTVYSVTPLYHPSALLTSIGGAVAGGSRLALATHFDPDTFWDEVRRYGVTVVSYVWTLLRSVVDAPPSPAERHHPVRLLAGSGMPSGLWRRAVARFGSASVLEFYASTEGEAVLANVSGVKVGAKGRPLPGSAEVRIAAYDLEEGRLVEGPDGLAVESGRGETGMLLARARFDQRGLLGNPLRGVFAKGDAWHLTGDLFRRDDDGDFWWVDSATAVIHTAKGPVPSIPIEDALGTLEQIDLAVAYGVPENGADVVVAAVTLRPGQQVSGGEMTAALAGLAERSRPAVVRLVDEIPLTTWYRPLKAPLQKEGLPPDAPGWRWDDGAGSYVFK
jgi:putative long chain acyl-CoA synthase